jgi:mevalonate kinase
MTVASAPAKLILFGEHAVVYGYPGIALPLTGLRANVEARAAKQSVHELLSVGEAGELHPVSNPALLHAIDVALEYAGQSNLRVRARIRSRIPVASGLGSGSAVATALMRAVLRLVEAEVSADELNAMVFQIEKQFHGTPSGIDNTVAVFETAIRFSKDMPFQSLMLKAPLHLLIGDTGIQSSTKSVVAQVKRRFEDSPIDTGKLLDQIGAIVDEAFIALTRGEVRTTGTLMSENHHMLQALGVSSIELDTLVFAAEQAGALGAKLTGGGLGGNMVALVTPDTSSVVEDALYRAGATRVMEQEVQCP